MFLGTAGLALFSAGLVGCFQKSVSSVLRTSTMTAKSEERPKLVVFDLGKDSSFHLALTYAKKSKLKGCVVQTF